MVGAAGLAILTEGNVRGVLRDYRRRYRDHSGRQSLRYNGCGAASRRQWVVSVLVANYYGAMSSFAKSRMNGIFLVVEHHS